MVQVNGTTITMTRGDTARISVFINDESGESYNPGVGDKIRFAMKKSYKDASPLVLIDIPIDTMELVIEPENTKSLEFGTYYYDIELTTADGTVDTFIYKAKIKIDEEVH